MLPGLEKQVVDPPEMTPAMVSLKRKINFLQIMYLLLFVASLVLIVMNTQRQRAAWGEYAWAITLGSAVVTRLVRQSLVAKYNTLVMGGRPGPLKS